MGTVAKKFCNQTAAGASIKYPVKYRESRVY